MSPGDDRYDPPLGVVCQTVTRQERIGPESDHLGRFPQTAPVFCPETVVIDQPDPTL